MGRWAKHEGALAHISLKRSVEMLELQRAQRFPARPADPDSSVFAELFAHRPSIKGTELLLTVIKATSINRGKVRQKTKRVPVEEICLTFSLGTLGCEGSG